MLGWNEILQECIYFISLYYVVFWVLVFFEKTDDKKKNIHEYPSVSIIIPAYNEEDNIVSTIKSAVALEYPKDKIKIIVVDDGSKDRTYERASSYVDTIRKYYNEVIIIKQENGGKYTALNSALKHVDTEYVATLDADSMPQKDALKKIMVCFTDEDIAAVSPVLKVHKPKNSIQMIQWFEYTINHFYKSLIAKVNAVHVLPGPLSVYRTRVVKEVKGFREAHSTEDMEIAMRIHKKHYKILQCNDSYVYTKAPYTVKSLYKQRHRWNYGTFKNLLDYRKMIFSRKYGDFSMFQLPIMFISGIMSVLIIFLILYNLWKTATPTFHMLQMYNFNIITYMQKATFNMIWLDLDLRSLVTFITFMGISVTIMLLSIRFQKQKFPKKSIFSLLAYLFFYYIFLAIVWLNVFKDVLINKKTRWNK